MCAPGAVLTSGARPVTVDDRPVVAFATSILLWRDLTPTANGFKPAFINRLDDVVIFDPLNLDELGRIVDIAVDRLGERLADRRLTLEVTPAAREWLALEGFDPAYGARPLRRLVQREIGDRLARMLLAGDVADGDVVVVDRDPESGSDGLTLATEVLTA